MPKVSELEMWRWADFSPCRTWRYTLRRRWNTTRRRLLMVLFNSSVADEFNDDPTNVRGIGFAHGFGYGYLIFCNLFAGRTPKPAELKRLSDPIGPDNDEWILQEAIEADTIVVAWGVHGPYLGRDKHVLEMLAGFDLYCFGKTKAGHPRHPLYLRGDTKLEIFRRATA